MEAIGDVMKRLKIDTEGGERRVEVEQRERYRAEYGLRRLPTDYEVLRIEYIKRRREACEACGGLKECQYEEGGEGFEPIVMTSDIGGRLKVGKELYFGVKKCRYRVELERKKRERREYEESGLPENGWSVELEGEVSREEVDRLRGLIRIGKSIYLKSRSERIEEILSGIGKEVIRGSKEVRYKNIRELLTRLRVTSEEYHEEQRRAIGAEVLILEGLKVEQSRYNAEQLEIIIGGRRRRGLMSIISGEEGIRKQGEGLRRELRGYEEIEI